jgi:site-specific recombinase XerD
MSDLPTPLVPVRAHQRGLMAIPAIVTEASPEAAQRFFEFFTAQIPNENTSRAYYRAVRNFFAWCQAQGLISLKGVQPFHVAAYLKHLEREPLGRSQVPRSKPTVKQHLAAVRMLFDHLVVSQVLPVNPAHAVRAPKYAAKKGKTPVLSGEEARQLLGSIDTSTAVGLRDRALIGVLTYAFARVGATVAMRVEDYYPQGKRWWVRLHEKGGKRHELPAHHRLEEYLDAYIESAGIAGDKKGPLFRTALAQTGKLTATRMHRVDAYRMVRRRARDAGIRTRIGCHTFRATGITNYLQNDGTLENAQAMAAHESPRTTKLYDRRGDTVTLDEVEKITI